MEINGAMWNGIINYSFTHDSHSVKWIIYIISHTIWNIFISWMSSDSCSSQHKPIKLAIWMKVLYMNLASYFHFVFGLLFLPRVLHPHWVQSGHHFSWFGSRLHHHHSCLPPYCTTIFDGSVFWPTLFSIQKVSQ